MSVVKRIFTLFLAVCLVVSLATFTACNLRRNEDDGQDDDQQSVIVDNNGLASGSNEENGDGSEGGGDEEDNNGGDTVVVQPSLGTWWWHYEDPYLDFAKDNGVTEIYFCDSRFNADTAAFIGAANEAGMKVYWLDGHYQWLNNATDLLVLIQKYLTYQSQYPNYAFEGIHLDIEPHQDPNFEENRTLLLTRLAQLVKFLDERYPEIKFDYDIPFWIEDEITVDGVTMPAYAHIIAYADRVFMMSYRDTAEKIYSVAEAEIEFAKSIGKTLFLGVETGSEEDIVTFQQEGKEYMYGELEKLRKMIPENFGISIHYIRNWYKMDD